MSLKLMYITNNSQVARVAEKNGVDRIWIDLETEGKAERQKGLNTVKSKHSIQDIEIIKPMLTKAEMLVRINPWSERSKKEIDSVIAAGADIIMLPMWKSVDEVKEFIDAIYGRCKSLLLLETIEAEHCLDSVLKIPGINEIHIGMNDLHLAYGLTFMFELLSNGKIEEICKKLEGSGISYGFGGIGMMGTGLLPTPEEIINEHYRLGSTGMILSRSFCNYEKIKNLEEIDSIFFEGIKAIRKQEKKASQMTLNEYLLNKQQVKIGVETVLRNMRTRGK